MKVFLDTSVLVAGSVQSHPHYPQAILALQRIASAQDRGFISMHSLAETYATLTRLPLRPRIHPSEAARIIEAGIIPHVEVVPLEKADYVETIRHTAEGGWIGAKIYDALLLRCAARCGVERIYTFNIGDFRQLAPAGLQEKICAP